MHLRSEYVWMLYLIHVHVEHAKLSIYIFIPPPLSLSLSLSLSASSSRVTTRISTRLHNLFGWRMRARYAATGINGVCSPRINRYNYRYGQMNCTCGSHAP